MVKQAKTITPVKKRSWLYRLDKDVIFQTEIFGFHLKAPYFELEKNGVVTLKKGYAWNGCTPKFSFLDLFKIGTPDGVIDGETKLPVTAMASALHDALYQYGILIGITRKQADDEFKRFLGRFKLAGLYYFTVRALGWAWWH